MRGESGGENSRRHRRSTRLRGRWSVRRVRGAMPIAVAKIACEGPSKIGCRVSKEGTAHSVSEGRGQNRIGRSVWSACRCEARTLVSW